MGYSMAKHTCPVPESGCWLWAGPWTVSGYGVARSAGKNVRAHRLSWEMNRGDIPSGMVVCHRCDTPACVNPDHLFLGTQVENVKDRTAKGRASSGSKHSQSLQGRVAKLTAEQVLAIRSDSRSNADIALDYGVTKENVGAIKRNQTWRHL